MANKNRSRDTAAPVLAGDRMPKPPVTRPKRPTSHTHIITHNRIDL